MADGIRAEENIDNKILLCPMIDARRMEVYTALFDATGKNIKPTAAEIIDENSFSEQLQNNRILFFGDGAEKCSELLGKNPNAQFLTNFANSAKYLTQKAAQKFAERDFEDVAY